jgi:hypothetical protein
VVPAPGQQRAVAHRMPQSKLGAVLGVEFAPRPAPVGEHDPTTERINQQGAAPGGTPTSPHSQGPGSPPSGHPGTVSGPRPRAAPLFRHSRCRWGLSLPDLPPLTLGRALAGQVAVFLDRRVGRACASFKLSRGRSSRPRSSPGRLLHQDRRCGGPAPRRAALLSLPRRRPACQGLRPGERGWAPAGSPAAPQENA